MLRNFISSALNRSFSGTSWQGLRFSEKNSPLSAFSRCNTTSSKEFNPKRITEIKDGESDLNDPESLKFVTKVGLLRNNFPDEKTPELLFDGVPFKHLPIIVCRSTKNNTKLACHDYTGVLKTFRSSGREGFKNAKRGSSVAAYVMSISFGRMTKKLGITNVRLQVNGFGKGRDAVLKGLKQTGFNIVSVTDTTAIPYQGPRPKKARRL